MKARPKPVDDTRTAADLISRINKARRNLGPRNPTGQLLDECVAALACQLRRAQSRELMEAPPALPTVETRQTGEPVLELQPARPPSSPAEITALAPADRPARNAESENDSERSVTR